MSFVDWFMASFLYCFLYSYHSSNNCDSNRCRSFALLKALAKSKSNLIAIAFKSDNYQVAIQKSPISQYWNNELLDGTIIISYFGGNNNIFANCIYKLYCCPVRDIMLSEPGEK